MVYTYVKIIAVLAIIAFNIYFWDPIIRPKPQPTSLPPMHITSKKIQPTGTDPKVRRHFIFMSVAYVGILLLIVDAFRRTYEGPRGTPLGLAIGGLFSVGLSSLVYYVIWGKEPLWRPDEVYGSQFCARCLSASTDRSAGDTAMHGLAGTALLGDDDRCPDCKSRVKTLWAIVLMPLVPTGSYRVIPVAQGRYISRRTKKLSWRQVGRTYVAGAFSGGILLVWLIWEAWNRK